MKCRTIVMAAVGIVLLVHPGYGEDACSYLNSPSKLASLGYESGGPFTLDRYRLTKGRTELREFLWKHWHQHIRGVATAKLRTLDAGIVTFLYIVRPDAEGHWGVDGELDLPRLPPCLTFHADSLVRVPIRDPKEDFPGQTLPGLASDGIPRNRLPDSEVADSKLYRLVLAHNNMSVTDEI